MTTRLLPLPRQHWTDDNENPLAGGLIHTYEPGTTTEKPTYQDIGQTTPHANPIVLDSRGEPSAPIYWDGEYKVRIEDSDGVLVYEQDNYGAADTTVQSQGVNLLLNGDFEIDTNGDGVPDSWSLSISNGNTVAIDSMNVKSGANALKFDTNDGVKAGTATSDAQAVASGERLTLTGWTVSNATALTNKVIVDWYSASLTLLSSSTVYDNAGTAPTSLTEITGTATAPANAGFFRLRLEGADGGGTTTGATWFDYLRLERPVTQIAGITGEVRTYAGSTAPTGWLDCDGAAVSRTTYAVLFGVIGTTYGAGDGSTTFNLPDAQGRTIIGAGSGSGLTARALGDTGGEEDHQLTLAESPSHDHGGGDHNHGYESGASDSDGVDVGESFGGTARTVDDSGAIINSEGGDQPHNNMQPYLALNVIIKT